MLYIHVRVWFCVGVADYMLCIGGAGLGFWRTPLPLSLSSGATGYKIFYDSRHRMAHLNTECTIGFSSPSHFNASVVGFEELTRYRATVSRGK